MSHVWNALPSRDREGVGAFHNYGGFYNYGCTAGNVLDPEVLKHVG
jgi:hypothetical protein